MQSLAKFSFFEAETPASDSSEPDDSVSETLESSAAEGQLEIKFITETIKPSSVYHMQSQKQSLQNCISLFFEADTAASDFREPDDSVSKTSESGAAEGQLETKFITEIIIIVSLLHAESEAKLAKFSFLWNRNAC